MDIDTRIILSANVTRFRVNDTKMFVPLLENVDKISEVYADRGYDSKRNIEYVLGRGGTPYIAVRKNAAWGVRKRILKEMDKNCEMVGVLKGGGTPFLGGVERERSPLLRGF